MLRVASIEGWRLFFLRLAGSFSEPELLINPGSPGELSDGCARGAELTSGVSERPERGFRLHSRLTEMGRSHLRPVSLILDT